MAKKTFFLIACEILYLNGVIQLYIYERKYKFPFIDNMFLLSTAHVTYYVVLSFPLYAKQFYFISDFREKLERR